MTANLVGICICLIDLYGRKLPRIFTLSLTITQIREIARVMVRVRFSGNPTIE